MGKNVWDYLPDLDKIKQLVIILSIVVGFFYWAVTSYNHMDRTLERLTTSIETLAETQKEIKDKLDSLRRSTISNLSRKQVESMLLELEDDLVDMQNKNSDRIKDVSRRLSDIEKDFTVIDFIIREKDTNDGR